MCGITTRVGTDNSLDALRSSLRNLEYRGYDSAGIAIQNGSGIETTKRAGDVSALDSAFSASTQSGLAGIGHTRWSTHGPPTDANAHPHTDCDGRVAVVHNGIIENYGELREALQARGHEFTSDTDTEVVPHLVEEELDAGKEPEAAFHSAIAQLEESTVAAPTPSRTRERLLLESGKRQLTNRRQHPVGSVLLADLTAHLESEYSYPVDLQTVIEQSGDLQIEAPNAADTQRIASILEPLGIATVDSPGELFDLVYGNLTDDYIGRKYYDDRGSNPTAENGPTDTENVSF